jgi:diaminopimelate epimerase
MRTLDFNKMHVNGNDFVILNGLSKHIDLDVRQRQLLCNRQRGIGCDQILLLLPPVDKDSDFYCRIYNSDGSESGQCGNGMCALGEFIQTEHLSGSTQWRVQTKTTLVHIQAGEDNSMRAALGVPQFLPQSVGFKNTNNDVAPYPIEYLDHLGMIHIAHVGNEHAVMEVEDLNTTPVKEWGQALSVHKRFTQGANISFVYYKNENNAFIRIFERGAGETLACGSAAAAVASIGYKLNKLKGDVKVNMPGGSMSVQWPSDRDPIWIQSKVNTVFSGHYKLNPHPGQA